MQNMLIKENMKLRFSIKKNPRKCDLKNVAIVYFNTCISYNFYVNKIRTCHMNICTIVCFFLDVSLMIILVIKDTVISLQAKTGITYPYHTRRLPIFLMKRKNGFIYVNSITK